MQGLHEQTRSCLTREFYKGWKLWERETCARVYLFLFHFKITRFVFERVDTFSHSICKCFFKCIMPTEGVKMHVFDFDLTLYLKYICKFPVIRLFFGRMGICEFESKFEVRVQKKL